MATKNIEMNVKTSTGYDLLYPATESRQVLNLLTDSTKTYIGLETSATPDDAFRSLYLLNVLSDKASFRLTVKTAGGTPIVNLPVACDKYLDGNSNPVAGPLYTDENGVIDTFFANGSATLSITGYADLENWSQQYSVVNGEQYEEEVALTTRNFLKWTSSTTTKFSSNVSRVDVSCCGGGGGAGGGSVNSSYYDGVTGGGGAGGYSQTQENVSFSVNQDYSVVVGSGGNAGRESNKSNVTATDGANGGQSSLLELTAQGGGGGKAGIVDYNNVTIPGTGGQGNGNGGGGGAIPFVGQNGGNGTGFIYDSFTTTKSVGGGGGSGAAYSNSAYDDTIFVGGTGGSPGGGNGQGRAQAISAGTDEIGGGGGSGLAYEDNYEEYPDYTIYSSAKGGSGCVAIRMHLKAT